MTPEDKEFAREALTRGWLSIDQVEKLRETAEQKGTPLRDVARALGVVPETPAPSRPPLLLTALLAGVAGLCLIGAIVMAVRYLGESRARAREQARLKQELLRLPLPQGQAGPERQILLLERRLGSARALFAYVEDNYATMPPMERLDRLKEVVADFSAYLEHRPGYGPVLMERARAYDTMGWLPHALDDYEKAAEGDPVRATILQSRIRELREILGKKETEGPGNPDKEDKK